MEKDYITRTQKQFEAHYQSAFNTQIWVLSITGFTLATMFFLAGGFGFDNRCPASHGKAPGCPDRRGVLPQTSGRAILPPSQPRQLKNHPPSGMLSVRRAGQRAPPKPEGHHTFGHDSRTRRI